MILRNQLHEIIPEILAFGWYLPNVQQKFLFWLFEEEVAQIMPPRAPRANGARIELSGRLFFRARDPVGSRSARVRAQLCRTGRHLTKPASLLQILSLFWGMSSDIYCGRHDLQFYTLTCGYVEPVLWVFLLRTMLLSVAWWEARSWRDLLDGPPDTMGFRTVFPKAPPGWVVKKFRIRMDPASFSGCQKKIKGANVGHHLGGPL